ncbi:MAG: SCO family protein [Alphaproteobacteria bacterium]|nr:SCO family protein [Alphaproteobacteria bacterium]
MPDTSPLPEPSRLARIRAMLWLAVGVALVLAMAAMLIRAQSQDTPSGNHAEWFGGPFTLSAPDGRTVTERTLAGKPYAIFFGFTRCPDVCPTSLSRMARLRSQLGADGMKFEIVFVSVDPGHDSAADVGRYVALFGTPIIGLTGTEAQLAQIKKGFGVYSAKSPLPGGDYTIDHTATIYLMTATGRFAGTIAYDEPDATALQKLRRLVA